MRKKSIKNARKSKQKSSLRNGVTSQPEKSRRDFFKTIRNSVIGLGALGGVGYFSVQYVLASMEEADLTKIGNGLPAVVQIHDPQCMLCRTLQKQTRGVLEGFDEKGFNYLVANIKTHEGSSLAAKYAVPHVTLLLFDKRGRMKDIVRGPTTEDHLKVVIGKHLKGSG